MSSPFRVALVVEGGAMRGIFSAGVLDVFLEQDFRPFDLALGASVGASNILSYLAGQHGRTRRCFFAQMSRPQFLDPWRALRGGHVMDLDWLWDAIEREDPLDRRGVVASGVEYALVATCARTGRPRYLAPDASSMLDALKASCALPLLYRRTIQLGDDHFADGGISDPLPVREAYARGARTIVVVRSRAAGFVKKKGLGNRVAAWALRRRPALAQACLRAADAYADAVNFIARPPPDCRMIHVAPDAPLATGRTSRDPEALERDYTLGRALGHQAMECFASPAKPSSPAARTCRSPLV